MSGWRFKGCLAALPGNLRRKSLCLNCETKMKISPLSQFLANFEADFKPIFADFEPIFSQI